MTNKVNKGFFKKITIFDNLEQQFPFKMGSKIDCELQKNEMLLQTMAQAMQGA